MWKRALFSFRATAPRNGTAVISSRFSFPSGFHCQRRCLPFSTNIDKGSSSAMSNAVDKVILRSLKDHYLEASKMSPPPKIKPPSPFEIVKGSLDKEGGTVVLRRSYKGEVIDVSVMRLANLAAEEDEDAINQLFLHVDVTRPQTDGSLHFLCALYPDALGIHSVRFSPKLIQPSSPHTLNLYQAPPFQELEQKTRDAFHMYIEERGINESLFPFLQAWLYVKDHRILMKWFKSVGLFIDQMNTA